MLDGDKVNFIQKYKKSWIFGFLCTAFIIRVIYCKIQRREIMLSDEFYYNDAFDEVENITSSAFVTPPIDAMGLEDAIKQVKAKKQIQRIKYLRLKEKIRKVNENKFIHRENYHNRVAGRKIVVVVQVHSEDWRLSSFLETFAQAKFLKDVFIIFAHDYYDRYINDIVYSVAHSEYMQIFYPFNTQLYTSVFPGDDKMFCTGEYTCVHNHHKRDSWLAQLKHFWWWHVNYVFENIEVLTFFDGYILFLNYDQVIAGDFVYMLKLMSTIIEDTKCDFISLGAHRPNPAHFHVFSEDLYVEVYGSTDSNVGIAFNRTTWEKIKANKRHFCYYNDFRWDESLKYLSTKLPSKNLWMLASAGSRVLSTNCDETFENNNCDLENNLADAVAHFRTVSRGLYPGELLIKPANQSTLNLTQRGFWEDVRDHEFCMFIVEPQSERLQEMLEM